MSNRTEGEAPFGTLLEDPEEMRRSGYEVVDAIVERWTHLRGGPAWRGATRDRLEPRLHGPAPEEGRDLEGLLDTIFRDVMPFAGRIDHPRFLAFIPSSPTWASVLASFLIAGYNVFQGTWLESSGPSQIEVTVLDWFREWLGYPEGGSGVLTSGGSAANLLAIVAAREAAGNPERGTIYLSEQAHASVARAARVAGIHPERIRLVDADGVCRIVPASVRAAVWSDRAAGMHPFLVVGTAGTTNTGAIDPLAELADIAREEDLWYHVDAAYGGFAILDPEVAPLMSGLERSDSATLDPHKWFFQPYETGCLMVRDPAALERAFRIAPDYLQDAEWGPRHVNFCDRGVQLTRIFRALRVWLSVQRYGLAAHRAAISRAIALARGAEARIRELPELELLAPQSLGIVCFRYRGRGAIPDTELDDLNRRIQDEIVSSGFAMMSSTRLQGRLSLRFCVLNVRTTADDLARTLDRIASVGRRLLDGSSAA
ncbi:MAG: aminotransferase class I/II-fold pyridoxal phosphate-dependent enzyme [Gemmatimonadetes bacterium]|nr:aminotransferase class I/II-fold pyridoxal phosphate-dependent enzyme [Gemmatimonadota bacterium]MYE70009.1 aminotransferase class I/II-fold pyridoxal phosphate-dependent enzyme [Gemmatimonadota bacterium]MYJ67633.1 aminotransferase class I/II-fold pyridoxal phosphate-dependent enzyme [Gemmatimonadota bacterium]